MSAEPGKYQLTHAGRALGRKLNTRGVIPVYDQHFDVIDLITPSDLELSSYHQYQEEVIAEALAEDAERENVAQMLHSWSDFANSPFYPLEDV